MCRSNGKLGIIVNGVEIECTCTAFVDGQCTNEGYCINQNDVDNKPDVDLYDPVLSEDLYDY